MVKRELYMNKINSFIDKDLIKIITGVRRSGKSYFFKLIINELKERGVAEENILLIDFELPQYRHIKTSEELDEIVLDFIDSHPEKTYLFFDEIQNVSEWELSVNSYYKLSKSDIYITGSNFKLLSKELASFLTGRYVSINMYPFSFNEFIDYKKEIGSLPINSNELNTELENYFDEYFRYGGFPTAISSNDHKEIILNDLYSSIILNDIVTRYEIRNVGLFSRIIKFLIENVGNLISANSLYNYLRGQGMEITKPTIYNYLNYLESANILSKITREDLVGKREINGSEKYYLIDQGFYRSQLEIKQENTGRIIENIVYLELLRRGYTITIGCIGKLEVDFVCKRNNERIYIQVAYYLSSDETIEREFEPLRRISDNYPKYVLSMDKTDQSREGIKHLNIIQFLRSSEDI
ncbi:ATPase [Methanobrevibacter ruminantium M1]|uniref:ATPase n=1 Tax=Methanobrevibacter ruminantium (strain ATCC 35063 / DSM 1093 / JCM 13430 / OCM 146 / M1) TaxID=634498 RepID=D3DYK7_METRM|nr:ATP-binding protein [Methanobrevibacter ruminantium]ADC45927.1 ATPase [Methanobrevibacter ruminantium M1]